MNGKRITEGGRNRNVTPTTIDGSFIQGGPPVENTGRITEGWGAKAKKDGSSEENIVAQPVSLHDVLGHIPHRVDLIKVGGGRDRKVSVVLESEDEPVDDVRRGTGLEPGKGTAGASEGGPKRSGALGVTVFKEEGLEAARAIHLIVKGAEEAGRERKEPSVPRKGRRRNSFLPQDEIRNRVNFVRFCNEIKTEDLTKVTVLLVEDARIPPMLMVLSEATVKRSDPTFEAHAEEVDTTGVVGDSGDDFKGGAPAVVTGPVIV